jgi:hypothetical protein
MTTSSPVFVVTLRAKPGIDPIKALRATLKLALRRHGLKAIRVVEESARAPAHISGPKDRAGHLADT